MTDGPSPFETRNPYIAVWIEGGSGPTRSDQGDDQVLGEVVEGAQDGRAQG